MLSSLTPRPVPRSTLGRRLLALAPRDRSWWVPDHFHVECAGAVRCMLLKAMIDEARASTALARLLSLPVTVSRSSLLIAEAWTYRNNLIVHDAAQAPAPGRHRVPIPRSRSSPDPDAAVIVQQFAHRQPTTNRS